MKLRVELRWHKTIDRNISQGVGRIDGAKNKACKCKSDEALTMKNACIM